MGNIPIITEKKELSSYGSQEVHQPSLQNSVPVDYAQKLIDEATSKATHKVVNEIVPKVADEAASRAISSYITSNRQESNNLNIIDRKGVTISQQEYERLMRDARERVGGDGAGNVISLGRRFEEALNQKLNDEVIGNLVGNIFRGGSPVGEVKKSHSGIIGAFLDIADTKMGYALGEKFGDKATELVKMFGADRIGAMMDAYSGKVPQNQQQGQGQEHQASPEEQQKEIEKIIMGLDSTSIDDMNVFMQKTGMKNLYDAQRTLLAEQDRILQNRGLSKKSQEQSQENSIPNENVRDRSKRRPSDMNRDLIDRYDNPDQYNQRSQQYQQNNFQTPSNDFFGGGGSVSSGTSLQQTPEEMILSLNPDEPSSIHQYMSLRGITGVEQSIVKKMLMKEQRELSGKLSNPINPAQDQIKQESRNFSWSEKDIGKPIEETKAKMSSMSEVLGNQTEGNDGTIMKKSEFYEEIGLGKDNKQENKPDTQQSNTQQPSTQQSNAQQPNESLNVILSAIQNLDKNTENVMTVVTQMEKKIELLENEIVVLKEKSSNEIKDIVYSDIPYDEENILQENVNIDDLINKSPKIVSFNEVIKEPEVNIENDISTVSIDDDEAARGSTKEKEEIENETSEPENEVKEGEFQLRRIHSKSNEGIDWWSDRKDLLNSDVEKEHNIIELKEKEQKKFIIRKK
ncbi:MAG: hypothetical protein PHP08_00485 [Candidatus Dojkabacteria bacterium]|nr:hypothetical protein [Candidatus Dojkabacteria bacterium]